MVLEYILLGRAALSLGCFALGHVSNNESSSFWMRTLSDLVNSVTGNQISEQIKQLEPALIKKLAEKEPMNHDLEKLMMASMRPSFELCKKEFFDQQPGLEYDADYKAIWDLHVKDAGNRPDTPVLQIWQTLSETQFWTESYIEYVQHCASTILVGYPEEKVKTIKDFLKDHLQACFSLVFTEGLKDARDEKPFKAYLVRGLDFLAEQSQLQSSALALIIEEIQALKGKSEKQPLSLEPIRKLLEVEMEKLDKRLVKIWNELKAQGVVLVRVDQTTSAMAPEVSETLERVKKIEKRLEGQPNPSFPTILSEPPQNNELFEGRGDELEEIALFLKGGSDVVLINGIGGMGKSSLAQEYWRRNAAQYKSLAWVLVQNDNIRQSLLYALAEPLQLREQLREKDTDEQLRLLKETLRSLPRQGLLVLDNANGAEDLNQCKAWLDHLGWHLLITSRTKPSSNYKTVPVIELPMELAMQVFLNYYNGPKLAELEAEQKGLLETLLTEAERHTLLIEILAKVGKGRKRSIAQILDWWKKAELSHKELQVPIMEETQHQKFTGAEGQLRLETYMEALMKPQDLEPDLQDLIRNFCLFPAEEIKMEDLHILFSVEGEAAFALEQNLQSLEQSGWLQGGNTGYRMHPVVADLCLRILEPDTESCSALFARLESLLDEHLNQSWRWVDLASAIIQNCPKESHALAFRHGQLGKRCTELGRLDLALLHWQKASKIFDAESDQKNLAVSYEKLGDLHQALGDLPKALEFFEKRKDLGEQLYQANPRSESLTNGLAISYSKLGGLHQAFGDLPKALDFFEKDLALTEQLYQANPRSESLKNGLAISYERLGDLHQALGDLPKALYFFERVMELFVQLYQANPRSESLKNGLAISYEKLGELHQALGDLPKALDFFERETELFEQLYQANPRSEILKNGLAISYSKLGDLHQALGNLPKALDFFERETELFEQLYQANPNNQGLVRGLAISFFKLGALQEKMENDSEALAWLNKALPLYEKIVAQSHLPEDEKWLGVLKRRIARLEQLPGNL